MSMWAEHQVEAKVLDVLRNTPANDATHHFGRPYLSAYQVAIDFERRFPDTAAALGKSVGGSGTGTSDSLAQYLANELSKHIKSAQSAGTEYPVEGVFLSGQDEQTVIYTDHHGNEVKSSTTGSQYDLSLYRLRATPARTVQPQAEHETGAEQLHQAASWARVVLLRVAGDGSVLEQMERGEWDDRLTASQAKELAGVISSVTEQVRLMRANAGHMTGENG